MEIRSDFSKRAVVRPGEVDWVPSPLAGVDRQMLDRVGDEVARATSFVRYAAGSSFDAHVHDLGEEFFVMEGTFVDEQGHYPAGTYVRNPPGSAHAPSSPESCVIFVKLRQFQLTDSMRVIVDTTRQAWQAGPSEGLEIMPLHEHGREKVALVKIAAGGSYQPQGGAEIVLLQGGLVDEAGAYGQGSWLRSPELGALDAASSEDSVLLVKTGHLPV